MVSKHKRFMVKELVGNKFLPKYRDKSKWGDVADVCEWKGLEDDGTITNNNYLISGGKQCADFQKNIHVLHQRLLLDHIQTLVIENYGKNQNVLEIL